MPKLRVGQLARLSSREDEHSGTRGAKNIYGFNQSSAADGPRWLGQPVVSVPAETRAVFLAYVDEETSTGQSKRYAELLVPTGQIAWFDDCWVHGGGGDER